MKIRFYRDPETDEPHIFSHDVDEHEVAGVLGGPGEDRPGREDHASPSARREQDVTSA